MQETIRSWDFAALSTLLSMSYVRWVLSALWETTLQYSSDNKQWGKLTSPVNLKHCQRHSRPEGWPIFGVLGGTKNGTSGARIKILRPLFNTNTPLKPPFRHFGNHFGPWKSDFWPFYWFWSFSHWNSHWSQNVFGEGLPIELERKQKLFCDPYCKRNGIK